MMSVKDKRKRGAMIRRRHMAMQRAERAAADADAPELEVEAEREIAAPAAPPDVLLDPEP